MKDIKDRIAGAEGLRLRMAFNAARLAFQVIEEDTDGMGALTPLQKDWVVAHHGAAALDCFAPHTDTEDLLDDAETLLRRAIGATHSKDSLDPIPTSIADLSLSPPRQRMLAWAWARLGEVFRLKGNLPPFCIVGNQPGTLRLSVRDSATYYARSDECFDLACKYRQDKHPWAHAHRGAMIVNRRRYDSLRRYDNRGGDDDQAKEAHRLLETALTQRGFRYGWALFYKGGAHFLSITDSLIESLKKGTLTADQQERDVRALLMGYDMVIALVDDTSSFFRFPMHPGAIGRDEYLTLCYDLLEFLPRIPDYKACIDSPRYKIYLELVGSAMVEGYRFMRPDEFWPVSETIRFGYACVYVLFLAYQYFTDQASSAAASTPSVADLKKVVEDFLDDLKRLNLHGAASTVVQSINVEYSRAVNTPTNIVASESSDTAAALVASPIDVMLAVVGSINKILEDNLAKITPGVSEDMQSGKEGVLLRLFDVMMILVKLGVIWRELKQPTATIECALDDFNKLIPVLQLLDKNTGEPIIAVKGDQIIERVHGLVFSDFNKYGWLLAPQWVITEDRRPVLNKFLGVKDRGEHHD